MLLHESASGSAQEYARFYIYKRYNEFTLIIRFWIFLIEEAIRKGEILGTSKLSIIHDRRNTKQSSFGTISKHCRI